MPRGITHFGAFGADTAAGDVLQSDAFQGVPVILTGTADVINPYNPNSTNFIITTGSADAATLALPIAGVDDNLSVAVWSSTAFAHSITLPSAHLNNGAATAKTTATFPAFAGAGILLRAYNGFWQVVGISGTFSYS
jgi:hypothetical protein